MRFSLFFYLGCSVDLSSIRLFKKVFGEKSEFLRSTENLIKILTEDSSFQNFEMIANKEKIIGDTCLKKCDIDSGRSWSYNWRWRWRRRPAICNSCLRPLTERTPGNISEKVISLTVKFKLKNTNAPIDTNLT